MVLPVLTLAGPDYKNSSVLLLGVALGIYGVTQAIFQIPFGMLSDRFGRKPLIALGLVLFALGSFIAASSETVAGLIIGRALQGAGAIAGVIMAMVGDLTSPENRSKAMASIGASIGVAFALALVAGPLLAGVSVQILSMEFTGVRLLFWVTVGLSLVGIIILYFLIPNGPSLQQRTSKLSLDHLRLVLKNQQCVLLYGGVFVLHYGLMAFFVVVPFLLESMSIHRETHSWIYLGTMLVSFIVMVPLMIIGEKKQKAKLFMQLSIVLLALSVLLIPVTHGHVFFFLLCLTLFFIAFNFLEASFPSLLTKVVPAEHKGAGSGAFATCQFLGAALGGVLGASLYSYWGLIAIILSVVVLLFLWLFFSRHLIMPTNLKQNVVG